MGGEAVSRQSGPGCDAFVAVVEATDFRRRDDAAGQRLTRAYMNEHANRYFSAFSKDQTEPDANYATPCHRWEGGLQTTVKNPSCSPRGTLIMTHPHRRFPVTDTETGATAGFILCGGGLPDVHMFKFDKGREDLFNPGRVRRPRQPGHADLAAREVDAWAIQAMYGPARFPSVRVGPRIRRD